MPKALFQSAIVCKILERLRMRDKKFDAIFTPDERLAKFISPFAKLIGSNTVKMLLGEGINDCQEKGRKAALSIKRERR